jgi:hypothetical protein
VTIDYPTYRGFFIEVFSIGKDKYADAALYSCPRKEYNWEQKRNWLFVVVTQPFSTKRKEKFAMVNAYHPEFLHVHIRHDKKTPPLVL